MSDLNYPMPNSMAIPHATLQRAAAAEKELRDAAQAAVDEFFKDTGPSSVLLAAMRRLHEALKGVPA